jgi:hypothetical protein
MIVTHREYTQNVNVYIFIANILFIMNNENALCETVNRYSTVRSFKYLNIRYVYAICPIG